MTSAGHPLCMKPEVAPRWGERNPATVKESFHMLWRGTYGEWRYTFNHTWLWD